LMTVTMMLMLMKWDSYSYTFHFVSFSISFYLMAVTMFPQLSAYSSNTTNTHLNYRQ